MILGIGWAFTFQTLNKSSNSTCQFAVTEKFCQRFVKLSSFSIFDYLNYIYLIPMLPKLFAVQTQPRASWSYTTCSTYSSSFCRHFIAVYPNSPFNKPPESKVRRQFPTRIHILQTNNATTYPPSHDYSTPCLLNPLCQIPIIPMCIFQQRTPSRTQNPTLCAFFSLISIYYILPIAVPVAAPITSRHRSSGISLNRP
jgi:hypothetical protein